LACSLSHARGACKVSLTSKGDAFPTASSEYRHESQTRRSDLFAVARDSVVGVIVFVWQELPAFRQVVLHPGQQLSLETRSESMVVIVLSIMQISYWYRLSYISVPPQRVNAFLSHLFLL
jgi:hypothetical protein